MAGSGKGAAIGIMAYDTESESESEPLLGVASTSRMERWRRAARMSLRKLCKSSISISSSIAYDKGRQDAKTNKLKDKQHKKKVKAMNAFEKFVYKERDAMRDEGVLARLRVTAARKKKIEDTLLSALQWLDANRLTAEPHDFNNNKYQLEMDIAHICLQGFRRMKVNSISPDGCR